jgi:hypothetical protein
MSSKRAKIRIAFAKNGAGAVLLREGPGKWTRMLWWNTRTDSLKHGQWLNARVPNFSINSDGSLVIYFAQSYRRKHNYGTWVALSKPPWFSALALWRIGDSWGGGCEFITDQKILVTPGRTEIQLEGKLKKGMKWTSDPKEAHPFIPVWKKGVRNGKEYVEASSQISGLHVAACRRGIDYEVIVTLPNHDPSILVMHSDVHFFDFDCQGRLVMTKRDGSIYRIRRSRRSIESELVFNLLDMEPEAIKAPDSAMCW